MENFSKSVLNYFATFNETRFRFNTRLSQLWTNNELTLDLSVFPSFQEELLISIINFKKINIHITRGKYSLSIPKISYKSKIESLKNDFVTLNNLNMIEKELKDGAEVEIDSQMRKEIFRKFNLQLRKKYSIALNELQEQEKLKILHDLGVSNLPPSTLNVASLEQYLFDQLQKISMESINNVDFIDNVNSYLNSFEPKLELFDLHTLLAGFWRFVSSNSVYIYFHSFNFEELEIPILAIEVELSNLDSSFTIKESRDLVFINTPGINAAKLGKILTTPRASTFKDLPSYTSQIELYFQGFYKNSENFILKNKFSKIVGVNLPEIKPRIGLQITSREDRRILDYSELITRLDSGTGEKFQNLVSTYINGEVRNTAEEVNIDFLKDFAKNSVKNFASEIPLLLNKNQRKILTAAQNPKNKIIVVDGPPGTGKSYTITALVYLANLLGKSVLITSHKTQALDVVEQKLNEQFRKIHPNSKPPILRLTKKGEQSLNEYENTLSTQVINSSINKSLESKESISTIETELESLEKRIDKSLLEFISNGEEYETYIKTSNEFLKLNEELFSGTGVQKYSNRDYVFDYSQIKHIYSKYNLSELKISFNQLKFLHKNSSNISIIINSLESFDTQYNADLSNLEFNIEEVENLLKTTTELKSYLNPKAKFVDISFDNINLSPHPISKFIELKDLDNFITDSEIYIQEESRLLSGLLNKNLQKIKNKILLDYPNLRKIEKEEIERLRNESLKSKKFLQDENNNDIFLDDYLYYQRVPLEYIKKIFCSYSHISNSSLVDFISKRLNFKLSEFSLELVEKELKNIKGTLLNKKNYNAIKESLEIFELDSIEINKLYKIISTFKDLNLIENAIKIDYLLEFVEVYKTNLEKFDFNYSDLTSLSNFFSKINSEKFQDYLNLHLELSKNTIKYFDFELVKKYEVKKLKLIESKNITRFSNLKNHTTEIQRIINSLDNKRRLTRTQADILFKNITCIISPADLISEYFPMEESMVDWVIIDESSQVSIAESLSIMLRASQSIIFGDELQYGAVGAVNVNQDYSKQYFKDILNGFVLDRNEHILEEDIERISSDVSKELTEEEITVPTSEFYKINPGTKEWLKTFSIRTSTLTFAKALANYSDSLTTHFRSYPEIIDYSNEIFYKPSEINLVTSRIRTKPISEVLKFVKVETKGLTSQNINLDEIDAVAEELKQLNITNFKGSIGIICSFKEQTARMEEKLRTDLEFFPKFQRENNLKIWFIGDVQGEERDIIIYSFVEDKKINNGSLANIYPIIGGIADNIRNLKMQRLNVGFSRAKNQMIFIHSMNIEDYNDTRLGFALSHYRELLNTTNDHFISDESIFGSPAEKKLYNLLLQTEFFKNNKENIKLIAQFEIGKYIREEFRRSIPKYRVDFLLTLNIDGKELPLIIEYDGLEYHTKDISAVYSADTFDKEYLEYDIQRQLELESYDYKFLRINKFNLIPKEKEKTEIDVLNEMLYKKFNI